ncbi:DUF6461 domain-containing protein [Nonomuraea dietziae]|uniref:DUF6461 domain-containing protein n=1 Tax=Nonomuraea dietziae TaxID=65515 RepID=UPI003432C8DF
MDLKGVLDGGMFIGRSGSSYVVLEPNGYQTSLPEVLLRLSVGARVCSVSWGVTTPGDLSYAVYGRLLTSVPIHSPEWRSGLQPRALDQDLAVLDQVTTSIRDGHLTYPAHAVAHEAGAMSVVESCTRVRLDLDWLSRPHPFLRREADVPANPSMPGWFADLDPDVDSRLRLADPDLLALAVRQALTDVLARHDLLDSPGVRPALDLLASGQAAAQPPRLEGPGSLTGQLQEEFEARRFEVAPHDDPRLRRWQAAMALARAFSRFRDDVLDPLGSVYLAAGDEWPHIRNTLLRLLDS